MALSSNFAEDKVTIFDQHLLGVAAVSAPDFMERLAKVTFAGLDSIPNKERTALLETLGAWLDSGGSAQKASEHLFVHRNTVHQRLRKLEMYTGQTSVIHVRPPSSRLRLKLISALSSTQLGAMKEIDL